MNLLRKRLKDRLKMLILFFQYTEKKIKYNENFFNILKFLITRSFVIVFMFHNTFSAF